MKINIPAGKLSDITKPEPRRECDGCEVCGGAEFRADGQGGGAAPRRLDIALAVRLAAAAVIFALALIPDLSKAWGTVLVIISALIAGFDVILSAVRGVLKMRLSDECFIMTIAIILAFIIGKGVEGAAATLLFQTGRLLRGYAVTRTKESAEALADATGDALNLLRSDSEAGAAERFIIRLAKLYTPIAAGLAVLIAVISPLVFDLTVRDSIYRALVCLAMATPCAAAVSVPLTYFAGRCGASRRGILFKSSASMDAAAAVKAVVFDKTDTVVDGGLQVGSVKSDKMDTDLFLKIAAHAEAYSEHPIAKSIIAAYGGTVYVELIESFVEYPGRGITVSVDGVEITMGSEMFLKALGIEVTDTAKTSDTAVYMAIDGVCAGRILFTGVVKGSASGSAARELRNAGVEHVGILISDDGGSGPKVTKTAGITEYYAAVPGQDDKAARVNEIKARIGDRDTLVFAAGDTTSFPPDTADLHVAVRNSEEADAIIKDLNPVRISEMILSAKRTRQIIVQNTALVFCVKALILILGATGISSVWFAVVMDAAALLATALNSIRAFFIGGEQID